MKPSPEKDMLEAVWYSSYWMHIWARHCAECFLLIVYFLTEEGVRLSFLFYRWGKQTSSKNTQYSEIMGSPRFPSLGSGKAGIWTRAVKIWVSPFYYLFLWRTQYYRNRRGQREVGTTDLPCFPQSPVWRAADTGDLGSWLEKTYSWRGWKERQSRSANRAPMGNHSS